MANKLKKGVNQPGISNFLSYSDSDLTDSSIKKKRTPPSIEKTSSKRSILLIQASLKMASEPINKNQTDSLMNSSEDSDDSNEEETAFKKRLTKTLCKLMKKELRSVKSDMKALKTGQDKQDKSIQELLSVKEENRLLKIECDRVLTENVNLKDRITKIENSLLDNNVILHGILEDAWELDSNRLEKVIHAISFTMAESLNKTNWTWLAKLE